MNSRSHLSRSGLVVKFVLAMHEPRVRFTAATVVFVLLSAPEDSDVRGKVIFGRWERELLLLGAWDGV